MRAENAIHLVSTVSSDHDSATWEAAAKEAISGAALMLPTPCQTEGIIYRALPQAADPWA